MTISKSTKNIHKHTVRLLFSARSLNPRGIEDMSLTGILRFLLLFSVFFSLSKHKNTSSTMHSHDQSLLIWRDLWIHGSFVELKEFMGVRGWTNEQSSSLGFPNLFSVGCWINNCSLVWAWQSSVGWNFLIWDDELGVQEVQEVLEVLFFLPPFSFSFFSSFSCHTNGIKWGSDWESPA